MIKKFALYLTAIACLYPVFTLAADINGRVIKVADGDTLTILTVDKVQHRIRLTEIDAPEKKQPFGTRSQHHLSGLCFGKKATVKSTGKDRYQRVLGRVDCDGVDANLAQVRSGMAWRYVSYSKDPLIESAEQEARNAKIGLWSEPNPVPPWEWRGKRKSAVK